MNKKPVLLWKSQDTFWLVGGTLLVAGVTSLDKDIRQGVQKNNSPELSTFAKEVDLLGHPLVFAGLGGALWVGGELNEDSELALLGKQALQSVVAAEVITVGLKFGTGRSRPKVGGGNFHWLALDAGRDSFPSGHTAGAFAFASSLAENSKNSTLVSTAYVLAGAVGLSRLVADEHWGADVLAGALIGELCGRVGSRHFTHPNMTLLPVIQPYESKLILTLAW